VGITCKNDADFFSNARGLALPRIGVVGVELIESSLADITGSLRVWCGWKGTGPRVKQAPGG